MKKILSIVIIITLFTSLVIIPSYAANDTDALSEDKFGLMYALGVIDTMNIDGYATRGEYITMLMKTLAEVVPEEFISSVFDDVKPFDANAQYILQAYKLGYIKGYGNGNFGPYDMIKTEDALNILYNVLGYSEPYLNAVGASQAFIQISNLKKELMMGVESSEYLNKQSAVYILYNALFTDMLQIGAISGNEVEYGKIKGDNLLKIKHSVVPVEGVVTKNEFTSLYEAESGDKNKLEISDSKTRESFTIASGLTYDCNNLIGRSIRCYVKGESFGKREIVYIDSTELYNKEIIVLSENIIDFDKKTLQFKYYDGDKEKLIRLNQTVSVIYNGRYVETFEELDFTPLDGSVCFVDNKVNEGYETVIVESIEYMTVGRINTIDGRITDEYNPDLYLDYGDADNSGNLYINLNGTFINPDKLKKMDVLEVKISKDSNLMRIDVSQNILRGTITGIGDDYILIDGAEYEYTDYFKNNQNFQKDIKPSTGGAAYLNTSGKIVAFQKIPLQSEGFGFLIDIDATQGLSDVCKVKLLKESGNVFIIPLSEKVNFDGISLNRSMVYQTIMGYVNSFDGTPAQLIYYKQNQSGEINYIETASSDKNSTLYRSGDKASRKYIGYADEPRVFGEQFLITHETVSFFIPVLNGRIDTDSENFRTVSTEFFVHEQNYDTEFYNVSEAGTADIMIVYRNSADVEVPLRTGAFVVNSKSEILDESGDITYKLTGYYGDAEVSYLPNKPEVFEGISVGDIIQVVCDMDGYVENTNLLYSCKDLIGMSYEELDGMLFETTSVYNQDNRFMLARVVAIDDHAMRVTSGGKDSEGNPYYYTLSSTTIATPVYCGAYMFDLTGRNGFTLADKSDISEGDIIFIRCEVGRPYDVVMLKRGVR